MVLYRSPEYKAVQVNNEDKYQLDYSSSIFLFQGQIKLTIWYYLTHNHTHPRSYAHNHFDQVLCCLVIICRC